MNRRTFTKGMIASPLLAIVPFGATQATTINPQSETGPRGLQGIKGDPGNRGTQGVYHVNGFTLRTQKTHSAIPKPPTARGYSPENNYICELCG